MHLRGTVKGRFQTLPDPEDEVWLEVGLAIWFCAILYVCTELCTFGMG